VVDVGVGLVAAIEDARVVCVPVRGINGDGDGADGGNGVHEVEVVVFAEADKT
jgi:hypothetical protein